jgi:hypothetical protein
MGATTRGQFDVSARHFHILQSAKGASKLRVMAAIAPRVVANRAICE